VSQFPTAADLVAMEEFGRPVDYSMLIAYVFEDLAKSVRPDVIPLEFQFLAGENAEPFG
jgi:hypothetical protein